MQTTLLSARARYLAVTAVEAPVLVAVIQPPSRRQTGSPVVASNSRTIEEMVGSPLAVFPSKKLKVLT